MTVIQIFKWVDFNQTVSLNDTFPSTNHVSIVIIIPHKTPTEISIVSYEIAVGQKIFLEKQMYPEETAVDARVTSEKFPFRDGQI